ncbi:hypothetical protein D3C76_1395610 [compost metagenome]
MVFIVTSGASQRRWRSCTTEPRWALKRTHCSPSRSKGSTSVACRLEVLAPVSILARRPARPRSGRATHSRRPITVKWSNVFKMLNQRNKSSGTKTDVSDRSVNCKHAACFLHPPDTVVQFSLRK